MITSQFIYLYNASKANFFLQQGATLVEIGRAKNGDVYYKFLKNEQTTEITNRWKAIHHINN